MAELAWGQKVSAPFRRKVLAVAQRIGCDPSHLMACMWFESKLNPAAVNSLSGASGLIQFMPKTAIALGTTVEQIREMSDVDQLDLVERYFLENGYAGRIPTLADVYMAIFWPRAIGRPDDYQIVTDPESAAYVQNRGLDLNKDGTITKGEAASFPEKALSNGLLFTTSEREPRDDLVIGERGPEIPLPNFTPKDKTMPVPAVVALPLLTGLIPKVLELFSGRAQTAISKATGADPKVATQFMQELIQQVGNQFGIPVVNDNSAIQAVAAITKEPEDAVTAAQRAQQIKSLEDQALDYLDRLTGLLQKASNIDISELRAADESRDSAAVRADGVEVRRRIDSKIWIAYGSFAVVLGGVALTQVIMDKAPDGQILGALILAFGSLGGAIMMMVNYGFGSSVSSGAKDVVISEALRNKNGGK